MELDQLVLVSIRLYCITNHTKLGGLKQQIFIALYDFVGWLGSSSDLGQLTWDQMSQAMSPKTFSVKDFVDHVIFVAVTQLCF